MMMTADQELRLKQMTLEAVAASENGCWDQVCTLYQRRSQDFPLEAVSPALASQLIGWDRTVQERVKIVQAAIQQELGNIQDRRRQLQQFKRSWVPSSTITGVTRVV